MLTLILDSEMNLHFPSSNRVELQNSVNQMITKIRQLEGKVEQKIIDIANLGVNNQINFETIKNFMDNNYIKITDEKVNTIYKNMLDNNYDNEKENAYTFFISIPLYLKSEFR